jgi:hypothetical protein
VKHQISRRLEKKKVLEVRRSFASRKKVFKAVSSRDERKKNVNSAMPSEKKTVLTEKYRNRDYETEIWVKKMLLNSDRC